MRIFIGGPPRTGNVWLRCLLSESYDLEILKVPPNNIPQLEEAIQQGWFKEDSIFHQHLGPTPRLLEMMSSLDAKLVTIIRNPYDTFVSLYFFVQNFSHKFGPEHQLYQLREKPIDHPDVYKFLEDEAMGYRVHLRLAYEWKKREETNIIRYEDLLDNPKNQLLSLTKKLKRISRRKIRKAIDSCSAQRMRKQKKVQEKHIRKAKTGDWKNYLTTEHLELIETSCGDLIEGLGYEIQK